MENEMLHGDISASSTDELYTPADMEAAVTAMLSYHDLQSPALRGSMNGIKRRARARAIVAFCQTLDPPPPDTSITWMRFLQRRLFGRAVSHRDLHRYFATPGRKANNRVDEALFTEWFAEHLSSFQSRATALLGALERQWRELTAAAAVEAGRIRRESHQEERGALRSS